MSKLADLQRHKRDRLARRLVLPRQHAHHGPGRAARDDAGSHGADHGGLVRRERAEDHRAEFMAQELMQGF